jgi:SAM-dependent methyltransferase
MKDSKQYSPKFFDRIRDMASSSANAAVPEILKIYPAQSVIDVGCGTGAWVRAFQDCGVKRPVGIDGDYVDRSQLMVAESQFASCDLARRFDVADIFRRLGASERFDLAISLEVGEHLPVERAESLVDDVCMLADVVLFGAAIPFQGWAKSHINEQWQSFWARKFFDRGYDAFDVLRREIWSSPDIVYFYKQNTIFYVKRNTPAHAGFMARYHNPTTSMFDIVHPEQYRGKVRRLKNGYVVQKVFNFFRLSGGRRRSTVLSTEILGDEHWTSGRADRP